MKQDRKLSQTNHSHSQNGCSRDKTKLLTSFFSLWYRSFYSWSCDSHLEKSTCVVCHRGTCTSTARPSYKESLVDPMFHPDLLQFGASNDCLVTTDCRKIGPSALGASATPSPLWPQMVPSTKSRCNVAAPGLYCHGGGVLGMAVLQLEVEQRSR